MVMQRMARVIIRPPTLPTDVLRTWQVQAMPIEVGRFVWSRYDTLLCIMHSSDFTLVAVYLPAFVVLLVMMHNSVLNTSTCARLSPVCIHERYAAAEFRERSEEYLLRRSPSSASTTNLPHLTTSFQHKKLSSQRNHVAHTGKSPTHPAHAAIHSGNPAYAAHAGLAQRVHPPPALLTSPPPCLASIPSLCSSHATWLILCNVFRGGGATHVWARVARLCAWVRDGVGIGDWGWGRASGEAFERVGDGAGDAAENESEGLVEETLWAWAGASAAARQWEEQSGSHGFR